MNTIYTSTQSRARSAFFVMLLSMMLVGTMGCKVEKTQEGEMPDVDVSVEEGRMPKYDVDGPDIDIGLTEKTIKVPKVVVVMEEREIKVPVINVNRPGETDAEDNEEQTVAVEVEIPGEGHEIKIEEVYLVDGNFWVISRLERNPDADASTVTRISDRVVINAPSGMNVRHYIIGEDPGNAHNDQYLFIASRDAIAGDLERGTEVYSRDDLDL